MVKLYQFTKINPYIVSAALIISLLPIYGLLSNTAISVSVYGGNYEEAYLKDNPQRYWYIIKVEFYVALWIFIQSFIRFPFIESLQQRIINFRKNHKVIFLLIAFLIIPIIVTALIILAMVIIN